MTSLRHQLALGLAGGTVLLLVALYLPIAGTIRSLAEEQTRSRLEHDAETLLAALVLDGTAPRLADAGIHPIYRRPLSGHYYVVRADAGELRSRSLWDETLAEPATALAHVRGPRDQPLLAYTGHYTKQEQPVSITVAEELTSLEAAIRAFQWRYAAANGLLLLALLGLLQLVLRRALRPLAATRDDLRRLEHGAIETLDEARGPAEIAPLLRAFNATVAAMHRRTARAQKAVGNLAHALKAPLTVLGQLREHPDLRDHDALRTALGQQVERLQHAVDHELRRARTVGFAPPGGRVDLATVVAELAATLDQLHRDRALALEVAVPGPLPVAVDRQDLFELCGNLLDNACKWAAHRVRVGVAVAPTTLTLAIEDDGPGVAAAQLEGLRRRGQRLDETVAGHGLGLAIAADIAAQYGGALAFDRAPGLGGLRVRVTLPAAAG